MATGMVGLFLVVLAIFWIMFERACSNIYNTAYRMIPRYINEFGPMDPDELAAHLATDGLRISQFDMVIVIGDLLKHKAIVLCDREWIGNGWTPAKYRLTIEAEEAMKQAAPTVEQNQLN